MILDPIINGLKFNSYNSDQTMEKEIQINRQNIKNDVSQAANDIRSQIRSEVKGKLVSIKIDTATRMDRQVIGINVQYVMNGVMVIRNLCVKEMISSHTSENLCKEILDTLKEFHITPSMVYSATTDNAANMLKAVTLLASESSQNNFYKCTCVEVVRKEIGALQSPNSGLSNPKWNQTSMTDNFSDFESNHFGVGDESEYYSQPHQNKAPCVECELVPKVLGKLCVIGVRCSAHTLQLAVKDALKQQKSLDTVIKKVRRLCKTLRTPSMSTLLKKLHLSKPVLEVATRWHSTYDMMASILRIKSGIIDINKTAETKANSKCNRGQGQKGSSRKSSWQKLNLSDLEWASVKEYCESLKPAKIATKILQSDQLTVGDFYGTWLRCKLETESVGSSLSQDLLKAMASREVDLLSNPSFSAVLYMDSRYRLLLSEEDERKALTHLHTLWYRLEQCSYKDCPDISTNCSMGTQCGISECSANNPSIHDSEDRELREYEDPVEKLLKRKEIETSSRKKKDVEILELLKKLKVEPRLPTSGNQESLPIPSYTG